MFCHLDILTETSQFAHYSPLPSPLTPKKTESQWYYFWRKYSSRFRQSGDVIFCASDAEESDRACASVALGRRKSRQQSNLSLLFRLIYFIKNINSRFFSHNTDPSKTRKWRRTKKKLREKWWEFWKGNIFEGIECLGTNIDVCSKKLPNVPKAASHMTNNNDAWRHKSDQWVIHLESGRSL